MQLRVDRLIALREQMNISKAEVARRLNMSAMGYGRYEKGEREPSYQTVACISEVLNTSVDYLLGLSDDSEPDTITISAKSDPELFLIATTYRNSEQTAKRLLAYLKKLI